jgi:hypothetical protein
MKILREAIVGRNNEFKRIGGYDYKWMSLSRANSRYLEEAMRARSASTR